MAGAMTSREEIYRAAMDAVLEGTAKTMAEEAPEFEALGYSACHIAAKPYRDAGFDLVESVWYALADRLPDNTKASDIYDAIGRDYVAVRSAKAHARDTSGTIMVYQPQDDYWRSWTCEDGRWQTSTSEDLDTLLENLTETFGDDARRFAEAIGYAESVPDRDVPAARDARPAPTTYVDQLPEAARIDVFKALRAQYAGRDDRYERVIGGMKSRLCDLADVYDITRITERRDTEQPIPYSRLTETTRALVDSEDAAKREKAARMGYGLDKLKHDGDVGVRCAAYEYQAGAKERLLEIERGERAKFEGALQACGIDPERYDKAMADIVEAMARGDFAMANIKASAIGYLTDDASYSFTKALEADELVSSHRAVPVGEARRAAREEHRLVCNEIAKEIGLDRHDAHGKLRDATVADIVAHFKSPKTAHVKSTKTPAAVAERAKREAQYRSHR